MLGVITHDRPPDEPRVEPSSRASQGFNDLVGRVLERAAARSTKYGVPDPGSSQCIELGGNPPASEAEYDLAP